MIEQINTVYRLSFYMSYRELIYISTIGDSHRDGSLIIRTSKYIYLILYIYILFTCETLIYKMVIWISIVWQEHENDLFLYLK